MLAARVLGAGMFGEVGLWGVTDAGAFVALNAAASETLPDGVAADVVAAATAAPAADVVTKCTKLSAGG